jgi:hypothetical protein
LDARAADGDAFRVLLFRAPPRAHAQQQVSAAADDEDDDEAEENSGGRDDACSSSSSSSSSLPRSSGGVRLLGGDAAPGVRRAAERALRALPASADADAGAAALRRCFGRVVGGGAHQNALILVAYAASPLRGALSAQPRSVVRLAWRGTHFLAWQAEASSSSSSSFSFLVSRLVSARGVRLAALAAALALGAAYRALCVRDMAAVPGACRAGRQLLAPLASLFLFLSLLDTPAARAARAALARLRTHPHTV